MSPFSRRIFLLLGSFFFSSILLTDDLLSIVYSGFSSSAVLSKSKDLAGLSAGVFGVVIIEYIYLASHPTSYRLIQTFTISVIISWVFCFLITLFYYVGGINFLFPPLDLWSVQEVDHNLLRYKFAIAMTGLVVGVVAFHGLLARREQSDL